MNQSNNAAAMTVSLLLKHVITSVRDDTDTHRHTDTHTYTHYMTDRSCTAEAEQAAVLTHSAVWGNQLPVWDTTACSDLTHTHHHHHHHHLCSVLEVNPSSLSFLLALVAEDNP